MTNFYGNNVSITITNHDTGEVRTLKNVKVERCECLISCYENQEIILHLTQGLSYENRRNYMDFFAVEEK